MGTSADDARHSSTPETGGWPSSPRPPEHAPNVVVIVLDDVGFAQLGCYGSSISTPNLDRLASTGVRFNNFHTTALCSPTRASLLTGRNPHQVGIGSVMELAAPLPGYHAHLPASAGTMAEILRDAGWNTWAIGKWHLTPDWRRSVLGPFDTWPLGKGFERFYGFQGADTDQFHPNLIADNHRIDPPATPEEGYHVSEDLVDQSMALVTDQTSVDPAKPFFLYLAFGACHAPHQAPQSFIDRYRGAFDHGWNVERDRVLERQLASGIVPPGTELTPSNPGVLAWDDLSDDEQRLFARMQEVYAGFLEHTDAQIGRLLDHLEHLGRAEDTIVVALSDNGASPEGGPNGRFNEMTMFNGIDEEVDDLLGRIDELGGPTANNHYPMGWAQAGNTPLKWYKQNTHGGGIRDPLIVSWPAALGGDGRISEAYLHVGDLMPTVLDLVGVELPDEIGGVVQRPLDGISAAEVLRDPEVPSGRTSQLYEMIGNRAMYVDGWKAVTVARPGVPVGDQVWELYHVAEDFAEQHDLAADRPDLLADLVEAWERAAAEGNVLPVAEGPERILDPRPSAAPPRSRYVYHPGTNHMPEGTTHELKGRVHVIEAAVDVPSGRVDGVLFAQGGRFGGFVLYVDDGHLVYDYNLAGKHTEVRGTVPVPEGAASLQMHFTPDGMGGRVVLAIDGEEVGRGAVERTVLTRYTLDEGFDVGRDQVTPVCDAYECPNPFTGTLHHVTIDIGEEGSPPDAEAEHRTAMGRQ